MESKQYSLGHIEDYVKIVKSWLRHFYIEIRREILIINSRQTPTLQNDRMPNVSKMAEMYSWAGLREYAMITLMEKSILRSEVLGSHDGT